MAFHLHGSPIKRRAKLNIMIAEVDARMIIQALACHAASAPPMCEPY